MKKRALLLVLPLALVLGACVTVPSGPSVMVLPGTGKPFEQFQADDAACRQFALQSAGISTQSAANIRSVSARTKLSTPTPIATPASNRRDQ